MNPTLLCGPRISMMRLSLLGLLLFLGGLLPIAQAQCPPGDVTLSTQEEVNAFPASCNNIVGTLNIRGNKITDLSPLANLQSIGRSLDIRDNAELGSLAGLEKLVSLGGGLIIFNNAKLGSVTALSSLTSIGAELFIQSNAELSSLTGLEKLTRIERFLVILNNPKLGSLTGLGSLTSVESYLDIQNNAELSSLAGLEKLVSTGSFLSIQNNPKLGSLVGLSSLTSIGNLLNIRNNAGLGSLAGLEKLGSVGQFLVIIGNPKLGSLTGLSSLTSINGMDIQSNAELSSLAGLEKLTSAGGNFIDISNNPKLGSLVGLSSLTAVGGDLSIRSNAKLSSLVGIEKLTRIEFALIIRDNAELSSLAGLTNVSRVRGELQLGNNAKLASLTGLTSLTSVGGLVIENNPELTSLVALTALTSISNSLIIENNPMLSACAIAPICQSLINPTGFTDISISGNAPGCGSLDEVFQDCTPLVIATQPPGSTTACIGTTVTASVATTGNVRAYQWYRNGQVVAGQTSATLSLTNVQPSQTGAYVVVVSNSVSSLTSTAFNLTVNPRLIVSTSPASATLTCASSNATLTATGASTGGTLSYQWRGPGGFASTASSVTVSAPGTYSLTATASGGCNASATTTVEQNTSLAPPTLTASATTTNQPISVTANGCSGGTVNWSAQGRQGQANGNVYSFTQPGSYTLSASCTLGSCTSGASSPLALQILPGGLAITGVDMVNCQLTDGAKGEYRVSFSPRYSGANPNPITFAVVNELGPTTALAPYTLRLYDDNPRITLLANQAGNPEARFVYDWLGSCESGTAPNRPPTSSGIASQTILQGQPYQLELTNYFSDPDGQTLTFQAQGLPAGLLLNGSLISGTPTQPGIASVSITALDPTGSVVSTGFQLTVSPRPTTPAGFTIVGVSPVGCEVVGGGERRVTFNPQYGGLDGSPVSFSVVNELAPTTQAGPYSLRLYTDNPLITLVARQGNTVARLSYNWLAGCSGGARQGWAEVVEVPLTVTVLGNPVVGETVELDVRGAEGQFLQVRLVNQQGRLVSIQQRASAQALERLSLPVGGQPSGLLLLQVSTPTQQRTVKVLKH